MFIFIDNKERAKDLRDQGGGGKENIFYFVGVKVKC